MRLRRSDLQKPRFVRRRSGKGFSYLGTGRKPLTDKADVARIKAIVLPPAWQEVWISPDPRGHIQAVGADAAGCKQYRYHDDWRAARHRVKFDRMIEVAESLPDLRDRLCTDLTTGRGLRRERVLAASSGCSTWACSASAAPNTPTATTTRPTACRRCGPTTSVPEEPV